MKLFKNTFSKFIMGAFALGVLMPTASYSSESVVRDKTLDYECRPRWDRFIVDENSTNWDKNSIACYDKYGNEIDPSKLYGAPKMYGEYEAGAGNTAPAAAIDYSRMYGKYDPSQPGVKPKPQVIRAAAPVPKKSNAKEAAKPKPVAKPAPVVKPAPPKVEPQPVQAPPPPPPPVVKAPAPKPVPDEKANNIAKSLNEKIVTEESYCTQINPPVLGQLPKGIVLMPGRTDLMSCVKN